MGSKKVTSLRSEVVQFLGVTRARVRQWECVSKKDRRQRRVNGEEGKKQPTGRSFGWIILVNTKIPVHEQIFVHSCS